MNLFNGRLVKPLTEWCCEEGQRRDVQICPDCKQSLADWREARRTPSFTDPLPPLPRNFECRSHPIFTETQLDKLATANALDEHFGIERYKK